MFVLYRIIIAILFYTSLPFSLLFVLITGKHRRGLTQRFAVYRLRSKSKDAKAQTIWLHAASVGEVQAARSIIARLKKRLPTARIVLTIMTLHGKHFAESRFDSSVECFLAPLDVPGIVERAVKTIRPDIYICIETELWPVLIDSLARSKVRLCLVNGRISQKSYGKYLRMGRLTRHTVRQFDKIAVISESDRNKYLSLGARTNDISVEGNVKYDLSLPANRQERVEHYKEILNIEDQGVFIAGSTHGDEEMQLSRLFTLFQEKQMLFLIAPRHTRRLEEIISRFQDDEIGYQLYSSLKNGMEYRHSQVVLIDTMGELSLLYGVADYIFCGGSLVDKGGHNLMEAAVWDRAVFYGPHIDDFHDAAELLESVSGGFRVKNVEELVDLLHYFNAHPEEYRKACRRAGDIARKQQGSSDRQLAFVLEG